MPPAYIRPIVTEEDAVIALPRVIPRTKPTPIPAPSIFDEPTYCFKINKDWAGHFLGAILTSLNQPDTWKPDGTHDVEWARLQVVEWVAKLLTENDCMPCCDDLVEQLTELVEINQTMLTNIITIVTNLTTVINNQVTEIDNSETIIDNSETVITQNTQEIINQYFAQYQQNITANQQQYTFNQMIYDGTPQSVAPDIPDNWNDDGESAGNNALCAAIERYQTDVLYQWINRVNWTSLGVGTGLDTLAALLIANGVWTAGVSAAIGVVAGLVSAGLAAQVLAYNNSVNDPEARLKARCCMFDHLKDQPVTFETFKTSMNDCSFDVGTNESNVAGAVDSANQDEGNYLAFLRAVSSAQGTGDAANCVCCDVILVATNDCVITPLGDCRWRIVQTRGDIGPGDPFCGAWTYYPAMFKDQFDRCINVSGISGTAMSNWVQIDCNDVEHSGVGGGGGEGKHFHWASKACLTYPPYDTTYLDIIVEAFLVE